MTDRLRLNSAGISENLLHGAPTLYPPSVGCTMYSQFYASVTHTRLHAPLAALAQPCPSVRSTHARRVRLVRGHALHSSQASARRRGLLRRYAVQFRTAARPHLLVSMCVCVLVARTF
jgi:hypothetical protein